MFSKLFGKKQPEPKKFFPENRLEALLMQAATKPALRPEFYKELVASDLFVLIMPRQNQSGRFVAEPGDTLSIKGGVFNGKQLIPVFTSERRLREYITGNDTLAKLNGQALFSMLAEQSQGALLNPGSGYGKEFTLSEIAGLADGSIFQPSKQTLQKDTELLISMPSVYPTKLVEHLTAYFNGRSEVKRAYFAQIHAPQTGEPPHLLFAIDTAGDFEPLASELNLLFRDILAQGEVVDMVQIGKTTLDDYFLKQQPFFQRQ